MPAATTPTATTTPPPPSARPSLPSQFLTTASPPTLHYQGAEALLYRTHFLTPAHDLPAALKHRPSKPYRHPLLDARLTRHRILAEARVLAKLRGAGVAVPALYALDWEAGWLLEEWVEGVTVRAVLDELLDGFVKDVAAGRRDGEGRSGLRGLMARIGRVVARVHEAGVVHGDLTTSNLMVRKTRASEGMDVDGDVVLIDFGLAMQSLQEEDRAVDLYVLERAFGSTHPAAEGLFKDALKAYGESYREGKRVLRRLDEVRMRGRKKIMIG